MTTTSKAGLNANVHRDAVFAPEAALQRLGVAYLGDGEWTLPEGARIEPRDGDDWMLTLADGTEYHVWTEA
jgi:hypothetical protein